MSSGNPIYSIKLPYRVRCELGGCGKPVNLAFKTELDGNMCTFCSPQHARTGEERWEEKKNLDIRIGVPPQEEEQMTGDNISEVSEDG